MTGTVALLLAGGLCSTAVSVPRAEAPVLDRADRIRLAEGIRLAEAVGDSIWQGWTSAPFAILLVGQEHEFLLRHDHPTPDFQPLGDGILEAPLRARPRQFGLNLLATFPAVGAVPTIVIGRPEATDRTSTAWVITLLHEHFHQWQYSRPGYYAAVEALGLSGGDQTGMWMLDYPFPYADPAVAGRFETLCRSLAGAVEWAGRAGFTEKLSAYLRERAAFRGSLKPEDARYLAFQVWQEGIARYTEYHVARWAAQRYQPTPEFERLSDHASFESIAAAILDEIKSSLAAPSLATNRRSAFYAFGAAEGLLLDAARPGWRDAYMKEWLSLDAHMSAPAAPARR